MNLISEVEKVFDDLWSRITPHVLPTALTDAKNVVADVKGQASRLLQQAEADAKSDAATAVQDVAQVATGAASLVTSNPTPAPVAEPVPAPASSPETPATPSA